VREQKKLVQGGIVSERFYVQVSICMAPLNLRSRITLNVHALAALVLLLVEVSGAQSARGTVRKLQHLVRGDTNQDAD
jgi:hypothetical protein